MSVISIKPRTALSVAVFCALYGGSQFSTAQVLEETVVTARKKSENLQSVPVTVSAFTETGLANRGINNVAEIGNFTPNVQFDTTSTFAGATSFQAFIRGVGQSDFALNADPGVGLYIDGVYYARAVGSVVDLLDVERVEVLKGPQGTLFGRNSIGGAVSVVTKKPFDEFDFQGEVTIGENNRADVSAVINLPIIPEVLLSSVAFSANNRDGYQQRIAFNEIDNSTGYDPSQNTIPLDQLLVSDFGGGEAPGSIDNETARAKLLWLASDEVEVNISLDYSSIRDAANPTTLIEVDPNYALAGLYNGCIAGLAPAEICQSSAYMDFGGAASQQFYSPQFITGDKDTTYATGANYSNIDAYGSSITVDWDISDSMRLKSISAYRKLDSAFGLDIDGSPLAFDQTSFTMETDQYSQEFQLNGEIGDNLDYTAGFFYFKEDGVQEDFVPIAAGLIQVAGGFEQETEAYAFFGEGDYQLTESWSLNFGIRYTEEEKTLQLDQMSLNPGFFLAQGVPPEAFPREDLRFFGPEEPLDETFDNTSIRLGASWQINDDMFTYFSYSQGFKSGGFTTRLTGPFNPDLIPDNPPANMLTSLNFDEETADNYELGFKSEWMDNMVRVNGAVFWNTYDDIQIVVQRGVSPSNENIAEAEIRGVELEIEAMPTDSININLSFGYLDAQYTEIDTTGSLQSRFAELTKSSSLQNTPEYTASLAFNWMMTDSLYFNANYSYTSEVYNDAINTPLLKEDSIGLLGTSLVYNSTDDHWRTTLGVTNLTDERYIVSGFESGDLGFTNASYNRPREWYLSLAYNY